MKLSDYVIRRLASAGLKHIFMLPGGGCMHLVDSVGRCPGLEYVCNLHEQGCAVAAEAYGQYTNRFGAALVTTGPGGTNAITGVAAAWLDSTPCLFLSGQVKRADLKGSRTVRQIGFQEIDIVSLVKPITKYAVTVMNPAEIRYHVEKASWLSRAGRPGPVWIDVPLDVQSAEIDDASLAGFEPPAEEACPELSARVAEAIGILNASERPVVLAGNGVRLAGAQQDFLRWVERLGIPVLTTWKALDFMADEHPLYAGRPGSVAQRGANFTLQNADCLISIGARLDFGQTGYNRATFARAARKVIVDIEAGEIGKLDFTVDVPVACDAGAFLREFEAQSGKVAPKDRGAWLRRALEWKERYPLVLDEYRQQREYVNNYVFLGALSNAMDGGDLLVPGSSGACSEITMQAFRVKAGMRVLNSEGLGPMGFGIAAPIGACLASGRRRTVSIDGDGGFHMNTQELEVVHRLGLPVKFFVLNNGGYGSIRTTQRAYFGGRFVASEPGSGLTLPDTCRVAEAYGIRARRASNHTELADAIRETLAGDDPALCEVMISPEQTTMPRLTTAVRADGTLVTKPLEDLWPFLDRDEFAANMIVPALEEDR